MFNEQVKAIPYFEAALKDGKTLPVGLNYELGELYLKTKDLEKALKQLQLIKHLTKADKKAQADADRSIEKTSNAMAFMSVPRNFKVQPFPGDLNSRYTEYNPVVSADESCDGLHCLAANTGKTRSGDKFIEEIYISYNQAGSWSEPKVVPVASEYNVGSAGISPDGAKMIIFMGGIDDQGSLFQINKTGDAWSKPTILANTINSKFLESTARHYSGRQSDLLCQQSSGNAGLAWTSGGLNKKPDGTWTTPANLGPEVNSKANEDAPFIHPDQKTLFFYQR